MKYGKQKWIKKETAVAISRNYCGIYLELRKKRTKS
jgi:hypothetical protein